MLRTTDEYLAMDRQSVWHPFTKHSTAKQADFPIIARGEGPYLFDVDGHRYLDGISSWWCCNLGHSHPRIVEALKSQCDVLQQCITANLTHPNVVEFSSKLVQQFSTPDRRILYASDGASATEAAIRMAVQYWYNIGRTGRNRFIALEEGYHGDTFGAMSLGFVSKFHEPYKDIVMPVYHAEAPFCAGCRWEQSPDTCDLECLASMRQLIEEHCDELAAVIVEPLCQGVAGMRIHSPDCLKGVAELCDRHDILLIVDEIATGFGRTGRMFSFEHAGIDPDIVCLGKGLSAGYLPVSATVAKEHVYDTFTDNPHDNTFYHGHTFAGNPLGMAAALACLEVYQEENIVSRVQSLGSVLAEEFEHFQALAAVENVRHLGMIAAVDVKSGPNGESGHSRAQQVTKRLLQKEIMLRPLGNVLYLMLPLIVSENVIRDTVQKLFNAVANLPDD